MSDNAPRPPSEVSRLNRLALSEDWAATVVGLLLLALILAGVITTGLVP